MLRGRYGDEASRCIRMVLISKVARREVGWWWGVAWRAGFGLVVTATELAIYSRCLGHLLINSDFTKYSLGQMHCNDYDI